MKVHDPPRVRRTRAVPPSAAALLALLAAALPSVLPAGAPAAGLDGGAEATRVRLLPITVDAKGVARAETVVLDKEVRRVVFRVDGAEAEERRRAPWESRLRLDGDGPWEVSVIAYGPEGRLGEDSVLVQRGRSPLRLRILEFEPASAAAPLRLTLDVSAPRRDLLGSLELAIDGEVILERAGSEIAVGRSALEIPAADLPAGTSGGAVLTATLALTDGRRIDDAVPLADAVLREELDVRLLQLQVVVLDRDETPVGDLVAEDFVVRENGRQVEVESVAPAPDVSLLMGLAVDSSGSMAPIWDETRQASEAFLARTLGPRDRAFLVDFDVDLELVREATGDLDALRAGLEGIRPEGGTALYDSIVFSLLQFERQAGRRGLVVLTDGVDAGSLTDPQRTVELAQRFGVPVYVIALQQRGAGGPAGPAGPRGGGGGIQSRVQMLKLLTEPSGGRLFRAGSMRGVAAALQQIGDELRNQYVLTYYTDEEIDWRDPPRIEVDVPGRRGLQVKTIFGTDLVD